MGVGKTVKFSAKEIEGHSLDDLTSKYNYVLFDSSALLHPMPEAYRKSSNGKKYYSLGRRDAFYDEVKERLNNKERVYITDNVKGEISWLDQSKESSHKMRSMKVKDLEMALYFSSLGRVIGFEKLSDSEKDFYRHLCREYGFPEETEVGLTDADLAYKSFVLSNGNDNRGNNKHVALLTNDSGIRDFVDSVNSGFKNRLGLDVFKRSSDYVFEPWR